MARSKKQGNKKNAGVKPDSGADGRRPENTVEPNDAENLSSDPAAADGMEEGDGRAVTRHAEDDDSLRDMMAGNFIEYASYVIRDRAIPDVDDGLKPVQRRILHSLHDKEDGRFHKVANIIGHTMQYHPHGDASIGNALVVLANKEYFIDRQGNFGNIFTGDPASAARYIECRLTPLAREVLFNREITTFIDSYDGRNREPVSLPAKVPSLLMLGSEGIAVGMTTRILPHNFRELLKAQIALLKGRSTRLYPDFLQGGTMDVSEYDDGRGRVKLRARIEKNNDKTLTIREIPASTFTESLIASIEDAVKKGKIKIASINDYTAETVAIEINLPRGVHADEAIKQLYAYTDCEVGISSNILVIKDNMPVEMTVSEVLQHNTERLVSYLEQELKIELGRLHDRFHERTLAEIFIQNRIYQRIEECESYDRVLAEVRSGLEAFRHLLTREITDEDIEKLLQLRIRRISRFDINKNRDELDNIVAAIKLTKHHLAHLTDFAIDYIRALLKKYGKDYPRRTRIEELEDVDVRQVALRNIRVGHDRQGQFVGTEVKNSNKNEAPLVCTEFDRLVVLRNDGLFKVIPIPAKLYVGPVKVVMKADKNQVYSMIYRDRKRKTYYAKRFRIDRYIMNREYRVMPKGCIIEALYTNSGVVVRAELAPNKRRAAEHVDLDFDAVEIRSTGARGFKITAYPVRVFTLLRRGAPSGPPETGGDTPADSDNAAKPDGEEAREPVQQPDPNPQSSPPAPESTEDIAQEWAARGAHAAQTSAENKPRPEDLPKTPTGKPKTKKKKRQQAVTADSGKTKRRPNEIKTRQEENAANRAEEDPGERPRIPRKKGTGNRKTGKPPDNLRRLIDEETPFFLE